MSSPKLKGADSALTLEFLMEKPSNNASGPGCEGNTTVKVDGELGAFLSVAFWGHWSMHPICI
jgi:hypothetical protein